MKLNKTNSVLFAAWIVFFLTFTSSLFAQSKISPDLYKALKYRYIGPIGNRVSAVVGVPGQPNVYYAGAASGGIFKSTDGGVHWQPIFDGQPVASIGALAVATSDPNVIWAGTGEPFIRISLLAWEFTNPLMPERPGSLWAWKRRGGLAGWLSIPEIRILSLWLLWVTVMDLNRNGECSRRPMEERPGKESFLLMKILDALIWSWIPIIPGSFLPACGR